MPGAATYAGGVSNDTYGCEAFSYSQGNVSALKSWFYFDNEFVALGAGINAPNATYPVITTLNQCLLTGPVTYATTSGGTQSLSSGTATSGNVLGSTRAAWATFPLAAVQRHGDGHCAVGLVVLP